MTSTDSAQLVQTLPPDTESPHVAVEPGHVHLVLHPYINKDNKPTELYLNIPLVVAERHGIRLDIYLRYLGWCILGDVGKLELDSRVVDHNSNNLVFDGKRYYYCLDDKGGELNFPVA